MKKITIENVSARDFHQFMLGGITPRPIALVSTLSKEGLRNLAPFSYFNAVSSIPPILMLSVGRKADGSKKDTLRNIEKSGEFVVNMVNHDLLRQMALTSVALPPESDEFDLAGLTSLDSESIKAFRVAESPIHFECKVNRILEFGRKRGGSTVIFGDVQCIHIDDEIIGENNRIDPKKLNIMGRLGRSYYTRVEASSLETVVMPQMKIPIGFEVLPESIRRSDLLTANEVAKLASVYALPQKELIRAAREKLQKEHPKAKLTEIIAIIKEKLEKDDVESALNLAFTLP